MDQHKCCQNIDSDWDEETMDEMAYDDSAISTGLDIIYENTKNHPLFINIYQIAAAKMISTDNEIGLAVCISYDYFKHFHACLDTFNNNPTGFTELSLEYKTILKQLR